MSEAHEHRDYSEELGAYALGALSDPDAERVQRHLAECPECRAALDRLLAAVEVLPASVEQIEPSKQLRARVMEIVEAEAELLQAAGEAADRPPRASGRRLRMPRIAVGAGLAFASVCVVAVVAIVLATSGGPSGRTIQAQINGLALAAGAHAVLQLRGTRAELVVSGLPAPAADHVDELWVEHGRATPRPAGTFVVQSGSIEVGRAVQPGDRVLVTVEPGRGTPAPTTAPLLVARV